MKLGCRIFLLAAVIQGTMSPMVCASKFDGMYWGATAGYVNFKTHVTKNGVSQPAINSSGILGTLYMGYGKQKNTFYLGGEFMLPYSNLSQKFDGSRIGSTWGIGFTPRVGYNLTHEIMASIGLGLDTIWFNRKHLYRRVFSLVPKFTLEGFVYDNLSLRLDFGYAYGISNRRGPGVMIRKRPQALQIAGGLSYRF